MTLSFALFSCADKEEVNPILTVTYDVECDYCLAYTDDDYMKGEHKQPFAISGRWTYTFQPTRLDTARMELFVSAFSPPQRIKASIKTNNGKIVEIDKEFHIESKTLILPL